MEQRPGCQQPAVVEHVLREPVGVGADIDPAEQAMRRRHEAALRVECEPRAACARSVEQAAHALGMAFTEGTVWDGGRQANPHLLDYKLQTAADAPPVKIAFLDAPDPRGGPRGSKGVGEPPVVPTAGAVANAIAAATGVRVRRLPMTPYRVWEAIAGA